MRGAVSSGCGGEMSTRPCPYVVIMSAGAPTIWPVVYCVWPLWISVVKVAAEGGGGELGTRGGPCVIGARASPRATRPPRHDTPERTPRHGALTRPRRTVLYCASGRRRRHRQRRPPDHAIVPAHSTHTPDRTHRRRCSSWDTRGQRSGLGNRAPATAGGGERVGDHCRRRPCCERCPRRRSYVRDWSCPAQAPRSPTRPSAVRRTDTFLAE